MACAETQLLKGATFLGLPFMKPNLLFKQHGKQYSLSLSLSGKMRRKRFVIASFETGDSEFD